MALSRDDLKKAKAACHEIDLHERFGGGTIATAVGSFANLFLALTGISGRWLFCSIAIFFAFQNWWMCRRARLRYPANILFLQELQARNPESFAGVFPGKSFKAPPLWNPERGRQVILENVRHILSDRSYDWQPTSVR